MSEDRSFVASLLRMTEIYDIVAGLTIHRRACPNAAGGRTFNACVSLD